MPESRLPDLGELTNSHTSYAHMRSTLHWKLAHSFIDLARDQGTIHHIHVSSLYELQCVYDVQQLYLALRDPQKEKFQVSRASKI